jgi:branched-chain amino acid aminotransferase
VSQKLFSNINGTLLPTSETLIKSSNEAIRSRYGLYESMLLRDGILELQELHWERLWIGLEALGFAIPDAWSAAFFAQQIEELQQKNQVSALGRIRLQIYSEDTIRPLAPLYYIEVIALDSAMIEWNETGLVLDVLEGFQKPMIPESNCKISHSQHYPIARGMMEAQGLDDVLLLNTEGNIIESAIANIFWVKDGLFYTPPVSDACLAGTMRTWLLQQMALHRIPCVEQSVDWEELRAADELFCSNGIRFIRWVKQLGNTHYKNEYTKKLYRLLRK